MERTRRLANKVAVITGASTGLGASMARTFAEEGAHVVINYPDDSELRNAQTLCESITQAEQSAIHSRADVSNWTEVEQLISTVLDKFDRLDILINNAGINS